MSKPKLPKVWVMFSTSGGAFISASTPPSIGQPIGVKHLYAPVQKPKVCVWVRGQYTGITGCRNGKEGPNFEVGDSDKYVYCPYCGGKIKVQK